MEGEHIKLWSEVLGRVKDDVDDQVFNRWFRPIMPVSLSQDLLRLGVPNEFIKEWIQDRYANFLTSRLNQIAQKNMLKW